METRDKGTLFWNRLSLGGEIINLLEKTKNEAIQKENYFLQVKFRTHYAQMTWEIMKEYPMCKSVAIMALNNAEDCEFDKKPSVNESDKCFFLDVKYKKYKNVNHLLHIFHIIFFASHLKIDNKLMPELLLLALLYSFGKNDVIKDRHGSKEYNLDYEISARYAISISRLSNEFFEKDIKKIGNILVNYDIYSKKNDNICKLIAIAEVQARAFESQKFA